MSVIPGRKGAAIVVENTRFLTPEESEAFHKSICPAHTGHVPRYVHLGVRSRQR